MSDSVRPQTWQPTRLPRPWDSPGKNTGVGCHFLLQCMKGKSESEVAQSCPTLSDPMDCSPPGSSVHGIFQYWSGVPHAQSYSLLYHEFFVRHNIYLNTRYHEHYNMVFFSVNKFVYHILSHSSCVLTAMTYCSDFVYLCTS